jgi:hypothetical protein
MSDSGYVAFIKDCVQERASLIGRIEAIESKMVAPGRSIGSNDGRADRFVPPLLQRILRALFR